MSHLSRHFNRSGVVLLILSFAGCLSPPAQAQVMTMPTSATQALAQDVVLGNSARTYYIPPSTTGVLNSSVGVQNFLNGTSTLTDAAREATGLSSTTANPTTTGAAGENGSGSGDGQGSSPGFQADNHRQTAKDWPEEKQALALQKKLGKAVVGTAQGKKALGRSSTTSTPSSFRVHGEARAVDAITLTLNGKKVVLSHLRAPGINQTCHAGMTPWKCGENGRDALDLIVQGHKIYCSGTGTRGTCIREDGTDIARAILLTGYAVGVDGFDHDASQVAARDHRGLWTGYDK